MNTKILIGFFIAGITAIPAQARQEALEEIIVTAQRREQNLQEVPISLTTFTGSAIEQTNIKGATDYLALTPNVAFTEDGQFGSRGLGIAVRGVNNLISGENATINSIGIYLDGFSVASVPNQVANPFLPDMERLEVLRGPQGTYFGRNSVGGALNLTTKNPTDKLGGKVIFGGESYEGANGQYNVTGIVNLPVTDGIKMRGVVYYENSGGLVDNICAAGASAARCPGVAENGSIANGADDSGHTYFMGRLKALWDITEQTSVGVTVIYSEERQDADENVPSGILDLDTTDSFGISDAIDPGTGFYPNNRSLNSHDRNEHNDTNTLVTILNITHQLTDTMVLKSITGFVDADFDRLFDNDLVGGVDVLGRNNQYDGFSWSTELRLEATTESLDWVVGFLYAEDDQEQENFVHVRPGAELGQTINGVGLLPPFPPNLGLLFNSKNFEVEEIAAFFDATLHLTDAVDLIAGGRFTHDFVTNELAANGIGPTCCFPGSPGFPGPPGFAFFNSFVNNPRPPAGADDAFFDFSPRFGIRIQVMDEMNLYAIVSKGYKAGGNSTGNNTNAPGEPGFVVPYNEETLWSVEGGVKSEWFDHRLRLNASLFHLSWNDLQFESFRFLTPGNLATNFEQTINIASAQASGVEIEMVAAPIKGLTISGGLGFLDTQIDSATIVELTGGFKVNLQGADIPKAPRLTASLAGEYRWPMGPTETWVRVEYIHRDGQYSDIEGVTNKQTRGPSPNQGLVRTLNSEFPYFSPDYDLVNLRAGFDWNGMGVSFYVQNLTDQAYYTGTQENFGASGIRLRPHPRFYGGSISYSFGGI
ncbi:MAG: TonB-dependent receptor [Gammaproteobacteria bacterium]